jgi:hypothetical protein
MTREDCTLIAVDGLDLPGDQAVGDVAHARAAVLLRDRRAEEAQASHLGHDLAVEALVGIGADHARQQLVAGIVARRLADHALVLAETAREIEGIVPAKGLDGVSGIERHGDSSPLVAAVYAAARGSRQKPPRGVDPGANCGKLSLGIRGICQ